MSFQRNDYLGWLVPRAHSFDGSINLHASGVPALRAEDFPPAPGDPWTAVRRFETALAAWLGVPDDEVLFTPGATGGTLLALLALARPGRRIVVEAPIYEPMLRQALRLGPVDRLVRSPERAWELPLDSARELIGPETSLVMITEPHNPSGRFSPRDDVLTLAEHAARFGAYVLINEVYRGYSDRPSYHGLAENIVVVSSFSKLIGAYWSRLGWLSGPPAVVADLRAAHWNFGMATAPAAAIGLSIIARADDLRTGAVDVSRQGLAVVSSWVGRTEGVSWHQPQGPGFGCLELEARDVDDVSLAERLHREKGVLVVPGTFFEVPGALRVSWLQAGERLGEGLGLLSEALRQRPR